MIDDKHVAAPADMAIPILTTYTLENTTDTYGFLYKC